MAKTKEELNQLKSEYEALNTKLKKLSDDELKFVIGGIGSIAKPNSEGAEYSNRDEFMRKNNEYNEQFKKTFEYHQNNN